MSHVDDFLCSGPRKELAVLRKQLKDGYDVDGDILGADVGEAPEGKFLGRLIRFTSRGLEWEADKKQVEGLVNEYGLECGNGVEAPGVKMDIEEEGELMGKGRCFEISPGRRQGELLKSRSGGFGFC